jgi:phosphate transport system substrate-binding protein
MKQWIRITALSTALGFSFGAMAADLTLQGSTTAVATIFDTYQARIEKDTGLTLEVTGNGSSRGVEALSQGQVNIAMISATPDLMKAKVKDVPWETIKAYQVGVSRVILAVHPSNSLSSVTPDQAKAILTGAITNWKALGGPDAPIVIITEYQGGGIRTTVEKEWLQAPIQGTLKEFANSPQIVKVLQQMPHGLAVISAAIANKNIKIIEGMAIEQPLFFLTIGQAKPQEKKLIDAVISLGIQ